MAFAVSVARRQSLCRRPSAASPDSRVRVSALRAGLRLGGQAPYCIVEKPMAETLLEFPCAFPLKIMGRTQDGFAQAVLEVVLRHAPDFDSASMEMRASRQGNYLSLTCVVNATSREQLDALYRELSAHPQVVMVL